MIPEKMVSRSLEMARFAIEAFRIRRPHRPSPKCNSAI